jgi:hypothetical protein
MYLTADTDADKATAWLSRDLADEFDRALADRELEYRAYVAMFDHGVAPELVNTVYRVITGLSAAGGAAAIARAIHLVLHRNDGKKVKLLLDDGRSLEAEGLSLQEVQQLVEDLRKPAEPEEESDATVP